MFIWRFIQNQLLGMEYLNQSIGLLLSKAGVDLSSRWGGSLQFFLYDTLKITILLCVLIFIISYIQSYFPPERSKRILGRYHGLQSERPCMRIFSVRSPWRKPCWAKGHCRERSWHS